MIYTTAFDVLSLQTSPFFIPGAIYQVYDESGTTSTTSSITTVTNIIDFIPRFQSLLVSILPSSWSYPSPTTLIRATVKTRACVPPQQQRLTTIMNRIGLIFDSVSIQPIELFGIDSTKLLPPLALDLPKLPTFGTSSTNPVATGYFDVTYLDNDLLIIRQNAPGGIFCLIRTNTIDP